MLERRVLVITIHDEPGAGTRAAPLTRISDLVHGYRPASVVIVLDQPAPTRAALGVVLRAHRLCSRLGLVLSVAAHSAPVRRLLAALADTEDGIRLVVHARADTAIATATALTTAA
ncbi:hypothetical protein ABZT17_16625 [Streptomyces sp. NPDC005648]|uniref:hypothetical protein n=1 Tax=Streptomyces sp. NPDC005648 TaxID=3157044 RepID=UPI0033A2AC25